MRSKTPLLRKGLRWPQRYKIPYFQDFLLSMQSSTRFSPAISSSQKLPRNNARFLSVLCRLYPLSVQCRLYSLSVLCRLYPFLQAPEAAQFFQGPRLSAYFDEMPSSPASPTLQFLPVPSADPPSDVLHTISPKATFSHAEAASINVPSQPASTSTASPPPPAFQAPSRPSITLPIPPPSPAFHAPHAHAISPPRANLSSSHSLEQESPLPPAPLFLAAHAPSSRAEAPLPTQPSFNEAQKPPSPNFNAPLRPSFTSPAHAPTEPDTVKATAVRLGATEVQIKACEVSRKCRGIWQALQDDDSP